MSTYEYSLHQEPHRHYRVSVDGGKACWNGADGRRLVSVTQVLDGGQDALTGWAARQGVAAGEQVARRWLGQDSTLDASLLSFGELAALQPEHPDTYRDHKASLGTQLHEYFAMRLLDPASGPEGLQLPYGLGCAVDEWLYNTQPIALRDEHGARVERCVGDHTRGVVGTYDAQIGMDEGRKFVRHRIDAKSSNTIQPKHFAQLAAYERMARLCGERKQPSHYLTVLHFTPVGEYHQYSIRVGSPEHKQALALFDAALTIYRNTQALKKEIASRV